MLQRVSTSAGKKAFLKTTLLRRIAIQPTEQVEPQLIRPNRYPIDPRIKLKTGQFSHLAESPPAYNPNGSRSTARGNGPCKEGKPTAYQLPDECWKRTRRPMAAQSVLEQQPIRNVRLQIAWIGNSTWSLVYGGRIQLGLGRNNVKVQRSKSIYVS